MAFATLKGLWVLGHEILGTLKDSNYYETSIKDRKTRIECVDASPTKADSCPLSYQHNTTVPEIQEG